MRFPMLTQKTWRTSEGAYINCYIIEDDLEAADRIARDYINKIKFEVLTREDAYEIDNNSVSDEGRQYYEQALIDDEVYVLHTYPLDERP